MAGGRLLSKAFAFSAPSSPSSCPLRRLSAAAVAGIPDNVPPETARRRRPPPPLASLSRSDSVLDFLLSRGLAARDIDGFASRGLLDGKLDRDLAAKFDLLVGLGFSGSDVAKLLPMSNLLSSISLGGLKQRIEFLKSVVAGDGYVVRMIKGSIWTMSGSGVIERWIADNIAINEGVGRSRRKDQIFAGFPHPFFLEVAVHRCRCGASSKRVCGLSRRQDVILPCFCVSGAARIRKASEV